MYSYSLKSCVWLLLVTVTLPATSASCERNFSKMKFVETIPRNSMTSERLGNIDLLSVERYELTNRFRWFVDEFDSRHDNRRIKLLWGDDDINSNVGSARICMRIVWICFSGEFVRSMQGWKVSLWGSEENSVWILKWTTSLGIFCKIRFTPAVTSYYQVHVLNAVAHLSAALLCYFWCHRCRNLAAVNCIILTLFTLQMGIVLW